MRFIARKADGFPLYWLDARSEADARAMIATCDQQRPGDAERSAFAVATLDEITLDEFAQMSRFFKRRKLKTGV